MSAEIQEPATEHESGELVSCGQCGRSNVGAKQYCSDCGAPLREPCCRCGALSLAGEKYCGACGANLVESVDRLAGQFETALAKAKELQANLRFDEAVSLLENLGATEHPRLQEYVNQAEQCIARLTAERDRLRREAEAAYAEARALAADCKYEVAASLLKTIPSTMRSDEAEQLWVEVRAQLEEIAALDEELSTAIACRRTLHLLPKLSQLLTLQPNHVRARQLAERFRDRVRHAAEEMLANHAYRDARGLLDQLPAFARNPELEALRQRAAELAWLSDDLRHAPVVDTALPQVARRLLELAPQDRRAAKLLAEVRRREGIVAGDPRRAHPPWAAPPRKTHLGCPIDWLTRFRRIGIQEELARPILVDHPGRLFVACGLALQGLEKASIRLNLLPRENGKSIRRFAGMFNRNSLSRVGRKRLPRTAWGLDLSAGGLKAVKLALHGEKEVVIEDCDVLTHRKALGEALGEDEAKTLVGETLAAFGLRHNIKGDRICLGLPGRMLLTRRFTMPSLAPEKMSQAVAYEARRQIPLPLEEVAWDYAVMEKESSETMPKGEPNTLLVSVRRHSLLSRLSQLRDAGVRIDAVQSDCIALHNFLVYDLLDGERPAPDGGGASAAVLDVGSDQTQLVVSSPTSIWFRSSGFAGEQFTRALVREFQLTAAEAEQLKLDPTRSTSMHRMYEALEPAWETLVEVTRSLLDKFADGHPDQPVTRLLGCGGSFQLHGLLRYLRSGF